MSALRQSYHAEVRKYVGVYGEKTTVAMMCGGMYNFFGDQAKLANRVVGLNYNASDMAGFPVQSLDHWCQRFTDQGYVLVVMDQYVRLKPNNCEEFAREVVAIFGPGTPIEIPFDCVSTLCAVVYVAGEGIGYATFESNTGRTQVCEFVEENFSAAYSGLLSAALADCPAHTLVVHESSSDGGALREAFASREKGVRTFGKRVDYRSVDAVELRDSHIKETIRTQFDGCGMMTGQSDTYIGIGGRRLAAVAFSQLLHFVYRRDDRKLRIMEQPSLISPAASLDVAMGGLLQLDILSSGGLLDHLPGCCTPVGKRAMRQRICRPSRDPFEITRRLNMVRSVEPHYKTVRRLLTGTKDFEATHRRLARPSTFRPAYWADVVDAMQRVGEASRLVHGPECGRPAGDVASAIQSVVSVEESRYSSHTVFCQGVDEGLDAIGRKREAVLDELGEIVRHLDRCSGALADKHFKLEESKEGDLHISVTRRRFDAARAEIKRHMKTFGLSGRQVACRDIRLVQQSQKGSTWVLDHPDLAHGLQCASELGREYREACRVLHDKWCLRIWEQTHENVAVTSRALEDMDVAAACAVMSVERNFVRPKVVSDEGSFVEAKGLRHPIVEHLDGLHEYVGNDVSLGRRTLGSLVFGINGSGKSCLMKSLGIAVCMAQAGMYVSADSFCMGPFARLFTRIWNNDDISRGLSTFTVEMTELNEILRRGDQSSLVLGDELCSGTERVSASAIITAGVKTLHAKGCRFMLATHQHDVVGHLRGVGGISVSHLAVSLDERGELVYERTLREGHGDTTYGVTVCRAIGLPSDFLEMAESHARMSEGIDGECLVSRKSSRYNRDVYMGRCSRCHERAAEHTHHRAPQCSADMRTKNAAFNLEPLCVSCHEQHHREERDGTQASKRRVQTSRGVREIPVDYILETRT